MSSGASSLMPNWKVIRFPVKVSKEHSATESSRTHNNVNFGLPFFFFLLAAAALLAPKGGDTLPDGSALVAFGVFVVEAFDVWLSLVVAVLLVLLALAEFVVEVELVGVELCPSAFTLFCDVS